MTANRKNNFFLIYLLLVTVLIATVFEFMVLPWHFKLPRKLALMGFAGEPNLKLDDTRINSIGFTGDVIKSSKDPDKTRIITFGGSAMFNRRMTERLKKEFNAVSNRRVEVLGTALRTHTTMSSLIKYRTLSRHEFDYALIYHGINDLFVNNVEPEYFRDDYSHMLPWYKRNFLLDNSLVARIFYNNFIWGRKIFGMKKNWYIYPGEENENLMNFISEGLLKKNILLLVKELKKNNVRPVLMTFAWNIPDNYSLESFEKGAASYAPTDYGRYPVELWGSVETVKEGLNRHNSVIREIASLENVILIDQENLMGKDLVFFEDVCHFSEEGTDKFIQNITGYFRGHGLL